MDTQFQSTLLMRGATDDISAKELEVVFQSTLLMRGATASSGWCVAGNDFNPRSSCEERHGLRCACVIERDIFQSTLLMRGATEHVSVSLYNESNFNPRSSCEERHELQGLANAFDMISIHAPHARSDDFAKAVFLPVVYFNPRSSCEERRTCPTGKSA